MRKKEYLNPKLMIEIIEEKLGVVDIKCFMKEELPNLKIELDEDQIVDFLNQKFEIENNELYQKVNSDDYNPDDTERMINDLMCEKYIFEPYSLKYFNKNIAIYREKSQRLFNLITNIIDAKNKNFLEKSALLEQLNEYDIKVDGNGNIYYDDIDRLVEPFVYNLDHMLEKLEEVNNFDTYLNFNISKEKIYEYGMDEDELYPKERLQLNEPAENEDGFIPLSNKQLLILGMNMLKKAGKVVNIDNNEKNSKTDTKKKVMKK